MKKLLVIFLSLALFAQSSLALFAARPSGMGGAFTAVANDANAPYWNPAGLALNPEVSLTGTYVANNRNAVVGDNVANLKMCYETELSPFEWIMGVGLASVLAYSGARSLADQGTLKKGWGRPGEKTAREESMAEQVEGTQEVVSLRQKVKETVKEAAGGAADQGTAVAKEVAKEAVRPTVVVMPPGHYRRYYAAPYGNPWYRPNYERPAYWEPAQPASRTKAQFALGLSWLGDNNPPLDQNTSWYTVTVASGFEQRVAIGANANFYYLKKISTDIAGVGADLDLGVIAKPVEYISFGLATKGILTTDIKWQDNSTTRYEMLVNAGVAVQPVPAVTLAADIHNILNQNNKQATNHYGVEVTVLPGLLARAGLDDNNKTAGLSLAVGPLIIDYTYLGGAYNRTQLVGATWRF